MDIFDIHKVKVEKANAMLQYRQFRKIAKLFRLVELFLAVILFSWILIRLPFVIGLFSDYFCQLFSIIISPLFIFLIGNVIVLILVVKSGQVMDTSSDLYEEVVNNIREDNVHVHVDVRVPPVIEPEEVVYEDKQLVSEVNIKPITSNRFNDKEIKVDQGTDKPLPNSVQDMNMNMNMKVYRRSQSENLMKHECFPVHKLKRSETEKVVNDVVEESNEEFQKRIERFIAKQIKFHHEEKLAIVAHN